MKSKRIRITSVFLALGLASIASVVGLGATPSFQYEGVWEGAISMGSKSHAAQEWRWGAPNSAGVRLDFTKKGKVSVYAKQSNDWQEMKPGRYSLTTLDTNAVIASVETGRDQDGVWIETVLFTVTPIDSTRMHVMRVRQVKNKDLDPANSNAVFGQFAYGELTRVDEPAGQSKDRPRAPR